MPVPDLDLRLVRYFVAVAEHGNVGRAAGALHVAQPSLSRQIDRLEALVGVRLLERTPRGTRLTDSGEVFLRQARELLRCAERAVTQARARAGIRRITIGHSGNLIITPAVTELRKRHPEAGISTRAVEWDEPRAALLEHRNDVVLARLPFPSAELDIEVLYEEERGLVVPACHRLAGRKSLVLNDFRDEPLVRFADPELDAWWTIDPRPDGAPAPPGPLADSVADKFELVAGGQALLLLPLQGIGFRPDLVQIPVTGIPPTPVVLATRAGEQSELVAEFRALAGKLLPALSGR